MVVGTHVDEAVAREVEQDSAAHALLLALQCLGDGGGDGVRRFRGRNDALALGKHSGSLKRVELLNIHCTHQSILHQLAHHRPSAVVAQTASVDMRRGKLMAQRVHRNQRRVASLVAKVVLEFATSEFWARCRFGGNEARVALTAQVVAHKWERNARKIAATAKAPNHHIGIFASHFHLLLRLQANHGLVESHMVEHRSKHILAVGRGARQFHSLRNGGAERTLIVGIVGNNVLTGAS